MIKKCSALLSALIPPLNVVSKIEKFYFSNFLKNGNFIRRIFCGEHQLYSLNQGQDNFFMLRECAQSIPRIKLPPDECFQGENRNFFDFHFNTPTPFPESESMKRFHASEMRAIDSPHKITPRGSLVKKFKKIPGPILNPSLSAPQVT